jgi:hypothetical protein
VDPTQERAAGQALRKFLELIKTDDGRRSLATHPKDAIGDPPWSELPPALQEFLKHLNPNELNGLNSVVDSFTPAGLLVIEEPPQDAAHAGFATLCKF